MKKFHPLRVANAVSAEGCHPEPRPDYGKWLGGLPRIKLERIVARLEAGTHK